jgi:glc operon protein GlcG
MRRRILTMLLVGAALLAGTELKAQQPTPPNLDAIPEKMPFSNPYGAPVGAERAQALIQTATAEATKKGWPMNIAVVDSGADLVAFLRMDGALLGSIAVAQHKARAAVKFRRPTRAFEDAVQKFDFKYLLSIGGLHSRGGRHQQVTTSSAAGCSAGHLGRRSTAPARVVETLDATLAPKDRARGHGCPGI